MVATLPEVEVRQTMARREMAPMNYSLKVAPIRTTTIETPPKPTPRRTTTVEVPPKPTPRRSLLATAEIQLTTPEVTSTTRRTIGDHTRKPIKVVAERSAHLPSKQEIQSVQSTMSTDEEMSPELNHNLGISHRSRRSQPRRFSTDDKRSIRQSPPPPRASMQRKEERSTVKDSKAKTRMKLNPTDVDSASSYDSQGSKISIYTTK